MAALYNLYRARGHFKTGFFGGIYRKGENRSAAYLFVREHRERNLDDEITQKRRFEMASATKVALVCLDPSLTQLTLSFDQDDGGYDTYL